MLVLFQLGLDERQRERRSVDRAVDERQQVGHGADVVLVPVREHKRATTRRACRYGRSGTTRSTPSSSGSGNIDAGVDDEVGVAARDRHHVHAELAEAAERHDFERRVDAGISRTHASAASVPLRPGVSSPGPPCAVARGGPLPRSAPAGVPAARLGVKKWNPSYTDILRNHARNHGHEHRKHVGDRPRSGRAFGV